MLVKDVMDQNTVVVHETATVKEIMELIRRLHVTDFPVIDEDSRLKGMVFERDLLRALYKGMETEDMSADGGRVSVEVLAANYAGMTVQQIMTPKIPPVAEDEPVIEVGAKMLFGKMPKLPVLKNGRVVGVISQSAIFSTIVGLFAGKQERAAKPERAAPAAPPHVQPPAASVVEKRFFRRVDLSVPLAYKRVQAGGQARTEGRIAKTLNISAGGVFIEVKEPLHAGELLDVAVDLYKNEPPIVSTCRVIRCTPDRPSGNYRVGILFIAIPVSERKKIIAYLDRIAPAESVA